MHQKYYTFVDNLQQLFDPITNLMERHVTPNSIEELVSAYQVLIEGDAFKKFVDAIVTKIESNEDFCPFWTSNLEAPIVATRNGVLSLRYHDEECSQASLYGVPNDIYFTLLHSNGPIKLLIYDIDKNDYSLTLSENLSILVNQTVHLKQGQTFKIESQGIACFARLMIGLGESIPVYDANSLQYLSMLSLNPISSRWYFMARVAALLEKGEAVNILKRLVEHENYNVRWVALQKLFDVDEVLAFQTLNAFKNDPHPFIARKAAAEWSRISPLFIN